MKNKSLILLITFIVLNINFVQEIYGDTNQISHSVIQFGRIDSDDGGFYFYIPLSWRDYIEVYKETDLDNDGIVALHFYYTPVSEDEVEKEFFTLYAFKKEDYKQSFGLNFIAEMGEYTFASEENLDNTYNNSIDKIIFNRFISELNNDDFIEKKLYVVSNDSENSKYNNIYVNDVKIENQSYVSSQDIVYLPIREIAEMVGYSVEWNDQYKRILLKKGDTMEAIYLRSNDTYKPLLVEGKTYMPSMYYVQFLGLDVNIDSKKNVKIYG